MPSASRSSRRHTSGHSDHARRRAITAPSVRRHSHRTPSPPARAGRWSGRWDGSAAPVVRPVMPTLPRSCRRAAGHCPGVTPGPMRAQGSLSPVSFSRYSNFNNGIGGSRRASPAAGSTAATLHCHAPPLYRRVAVAVRECQAPGCRDAGLELARAPPVPPDRNIPATHAIPQREQRLRRDSNP